MKHSGAPLKTLSERIGPVLDSVLTTNEIARLARREMDALRDLVEESVGGVPQAAVHVASEE